MGSLYGEQTFLDNSILQSANQQGFDVEVAASLSASAGIYSGTAGADASMKGQQDAKKAFENAKSKMSKYSRGSLPPTSNEDGSGNTDEWMRSSKDNPAPTKLELSSLANLPGLSEKVQAELEKYITNYCEEMRAQGKFKGTCDSVVKKKKSAAGKCRPDLPHKSS